MRRTQERDARSTALAKEAGWTVIRIWEHEVRDDPSGAARRVVGAASDDY